MKVFSNCSHLWNFNSVAYKYVTRLSASQLAVAWIRYLTLAKSKEEGELANLQKVLLPEMPKNPEEPRKEGEPPAGRWVWNDDAGTVELVSSVPAEEGVLMTKRQTRSGFSDLQQRSQWLAEVFMLNHRGRQSIRKSLSPAQLNAFRSSMMRGRCGDHVTIDDVKQVAVTLLQENYSLPIPFRFLAVLKSKDLDEVLTALLLYLSCFFEHKNLVNKPKSSMAVDIITEHQMIAEAVAKKEIAQKKLAVCYFSLIMDLEINQHQHMSYHKGQMSSDRTEWLLHACLYSFFCYVAWVTFGRKDLRDIQEEVGRLLYSDTFNAAVTNGSAKTGEADPKETRRNGPFKHRKSQRRPALGGVVNQRSPLMVCLLPSPKERSPHLFPSSPQGGRQPPRRAERRHAEAPTEELSRQLASVSFGILGKPLREFSHSTLTPCGEEKRDEDDDHEPGGDVNNNSEDHPGARARGSRSSLMGPKATGLARDGSTTHLHTRNFASTAEAVTSGAE